MNWRVPFCCILFGLINLLNASTGAARLSGVYTKRIATSLTLFNAVFLIGRLANLLMVPLLARLAEIARQTHGVQTLAFEYRLIIGSAGIGCLLAFFLIPTFVEIYKRGISGLERRNALPPVIFGLFDPRRSRPLFLVAVISALLGSAATIFLVRHGFLHFHNLGLSILEGIAVSIFLHFLLGTLFWIFHPAIFRPIWKIGTLAKLSEIPRDFLILNVFCQAFWVVGWISAVYAGAIHPQRDITSVSLSGIITGVSTVLFTFFVDPKAALATDQAAHGIRSEAQIRTIVFYLAFGSTVGTFISQILFLPASEIIASVAAHI